MTRSERLRRAYCHEEMDRPAVYSRTGFPDGDTTYDRLKAYLRGHSELKLGWHGRAFESRPMTRHDVEPHSADFERHTTTLVTPAGELESRRLESLHGQPGMDETYFIKEREDALRYLSLPAPQIGGDTSGFEAALAQVGDGGIVDVSLGSNPAGLVATLCGSDTFAIMSMTDRDILHALCEREMKATMAALKFLLQNGIGPFFSLAGEEYIVPPLHGPADFEDFNVRYDKPILDLIHEAGGRVHIHCHGSIKKVLPGFLAMGVDVMHPFEPPPMGDLTAAEAKQMVGNRICIEGNIQIHHMYEHGPNQVAEETRALIRDAFGNGTGLIVSPSASPYIRGEGEACFPQYRAMIDTVLAYRG
ncbi:MAG: uroporphyrinogen decarboxylase family protein [Anaerolineae bacterium]